MTFKANEVMSRAATTLQDEDSVRWTAPELLKYLNDGLREIVTLKPNALTKTVELELDEGTLQTLPAQYTVLSRVIRNMTSAGVGAGAIRSLDARSIMDSFIPGWQDDNKVPFAKSVVHVIHDMAEPRTFYVAPGNDGTGIIEAVVGAFPNPVTGSGSNVSGYTDTVDLPDTYMNPLVDYVLYRAYSKDARLAGSAARAQAHYSVFRAAVTDFSAAETGMSLARSNDQAKEG